MLAHWSNAKASYAVSGVTGVASRSNLWDTVVDPDRGRSSSLGSH